MSKPLLYLETTISSYLTAWPSRDMWVAGHQQITHEWWSTRRDAFELVISELVMVEAGAGDPEAAKKRLELLRNIRQLEVTQAAVGLAKKLVGPGLIPPKAATDAVHVAVCAVHQVQFLMTWNCTHLANGVIAASVGEVCRAAGYEPPMIYTPELLMGAEDVD